MLLYCNICYILQYNKSITLKQYALEKIIVFLAAQSWDATHCLHIFVSY